MAVLYSDLCSVLYNYCWLPKISVKKINPNFVAIFYDLFILLTSVLLSRCLDSGPVVELKCACCLNQHHYLTLYKWGECWPVSVDKAYLVCSRGPWSLMGLHWWAVMLLGEEQSSPCVQPAHCNHCRKASASLSPNQVLLADSWRSELSESGLEALTKHWGRILNAEFGTGLCWLCCLLAPMQLGGLCELLRPFSLQWSLVGVKGRALNKHPRCHVGHVGLWGLCDLSTELLPEVVTALEVLEWPGLPGSGLTSLWKAVPKIWQSIMVS